MYVKGAPLHVPMGISTFACKRKCQSISIMLNKAIVRISKLEVKIHKNAINSG